MVREAPCGSPLKMPVTKSELSLLMMTKVFPAVGVKPEPRKPLSVALPRLTVPVTFA